LLIALPAQGAAPAKAAAGPVEVSNMLVKIVEQVDVPAREAGALAAVHVSEGQLVEDGAAIAQIEDTEASIVAERAKAELAVARHQSENDVAVRFSKKSMEVAKAELTRAEESNKRYAKSVSDSELDRLRLLVEKGTLEIEQAQHDRVTASLTGRVKDFECRAAVEKVARHKVSAPVAGLIVQVHRHRGEWVKPGEPVVRIQRLDRLRAEGFLKASALTQDLQGRPVKLSVDLPGKPGVEFPGKIVFIDPEIDPVNAQVRVWVEVPNPGLRLRPGMRASMTLDLSR
jgi:macrolide-specific efflux system membrane fusion protein